jgi:hypothetical protein
VYTKEASSAASAKVGFSVSAAPPNTKLHAAADKTQRRDVGDDSGSWDRSASAGSDDDENDNGVVAFVWGDQEDTSPRKLPDDMKAR